MSHEPTLPESRPRPSRAQRIVAAAFLGAFGLTIITVLFTGLAVRRHSAAQQPPAAAPAAAIRDSAAERAESVEPTDANRAADEPRDRAAGELPDRNGEPERLPR